MEIRYYVLIPVWGIPFAVHHLRVVGLSIKNIFDRWEKTRLEKILHQKLAYFFENERNKYWTRVNYTFSISHQCESGGFHIWSLRSWFAFVWYAKRARQVFGVKCSSPIWLALNLSNMFLFYEFHGQPLSIYSKESR